jgi:hypothetical protein
MKFYVIRQGPFVGCGVYFCGLLDGDPMWSSKQSRALRFRKKDRDMAELTAVGLDEESRVVRVATLHKRSDT